MQNPKSTIVIPCYNASKYLVETIESCKKQTVPVEIVAVDDGSTDNTYEILKEHGIFTIQQPNGGLGKAMNTGVSWSKTPYYVHLSADDRLLPDFIEKAEAMMNTHDVDVVLPKYSTFGHENFIWEIGGFSEEIMTQNTVFFSSLTKRSLWERLCGFEENMPASGLEDWEFWIRAYKAEATLVKMDDIGVEYRWHDTNLSKTCWPKRDEIIQWLRDNRGIVS